MLDRRSFIKYTSGVALSAISSSSSVASHSDSINNFGWIPHHKRPPEVKKFHDDFIKSIKPFKIDGFYRKKKSEKGKLWDCAKAIYGSHLKCFKQNANSCTGQAKAKAEWYLQCVQKVLEGKRHKVILPYEPYGYAQGRVAANIPSHIEGGTGSGCAKAANIYGVLNSTIDGLPIWDEDRLTISWPGQIDNDWGRNGAPVRYVNEGKKHLVRTTALIRTVDEALAALTNGYPITVASAWGGMDRPPVTGNPPVLLNRRTTTWMHMMTLTNFWYHPSLSLIFYIENSWGASFHANSQPDDSPSGGFWVRPEDLQYMLNEKDSFVYSMFDGFPENDLDKSLFDLIGD